MNENPLEQSHEKIPTKEEILKVISQFSESAVLVRELADHQGVYLLEMKEPDEKPGEYKEYLYVRKGKFPNRQKALATTIYVVYYEDHMPISGENIAVYKPETGKWEDVV